MAQKMDQLQGAQKLRDAKWVGKEQTYKKKIQQLEAKVGRNVVSKNGTVVMKGIRIGYKLYLPYSQSVIKTCTTYMYMIEVWPINVPSFY